uniref:Gfo/Idh/MocA-like oxidoreductase N-terminal domain-containing protein n=1 Tax=Odontella aurita TaxID=265563 RepID=A0A7S4K568_9STRA
MASSRDDISGGGADGTDKKKKARVAVVGCGGWTQGWHLPNLSHRNDVDVIALVDPSSDAPGVGGCTPSLCVSMKELCERHGVSRRYRSVEELLSSDDELKLDGVLVAVPHRHHSSVGEAVLKAGKHLLMEKPMTADVDEARSLYELSKDGRGHGRRLAFLLNNTANWQPGTIAAYDAVSSGRIGAIRHVNCILAAPLGWLFEGEEHSSWNKVEESGNGTMKGNGFGWGQFSHSFAWIFKVTGLTPSSVFAKSTKSETTGADLFDAAIITCTNGCTISASGVGTCPDGGFKVVGNWIFGTGGMLSYCGLAGSDNVQAVDDDDDGADSNERSAARNRMELWTNDGEHEYGPPVEFEHLDQDGAGPGSLDAWIRACRGEDYFEGAGAVVGLKAVGAIDAMYRSFESGKEETVRGCEDLCE